MIKRLFSNTNPHLMRPLYYRSFSSTGIVNLKMVENNETHIEEFVPPLSGIKFVNANPFLRQVCERTTTDGFYPRIKKHEEYLVFDPEHTKNDLKELIKKGQHDQIFSIIN